MKSTTRNLVIVASVIVVLGGALAALKLTEKTEQNVSSSVSSTAEIDLVSKKTEDIQSMEVTNEKGSFTILPQKAKNNNSSNSSVEYTIKELNDAPMDSSAIERVVKYGFSLVATKNIGEVSNLTEYGLDKPKTTIKVNFKDGSNFNYKIGNASASDSTSYYMCSDSSKNVYVVSIDEGMLKDKMDFVNKTILSITPPPAKQGEKPQEANEFHKIVLSGTNYPQSITLEKNKDSSLLITAPAKFDADGTNTSNLMKSVETMTASTAAAVNPDAAALKSFGLDKPTAVIEFSVNDKSYKLMAGASKDKDRYVMLSGVNVVYLVPNASVGVWADTSLFNLRSKFVRIPMITEVQGMKVTVGSETNTFSLTRKKDEKNSTQEKPVYNYEVTGNGGKKLTYDKNFKNYYQTVIAVMLLEDSQEKPKGSPRVTLEYSYFNGTKDTVQYFDAGDRRCLAVVNGMTVGVIKSNDVDMIIQNTKKMQNNELIATD